jgi:predicted membrane-bound spermidine synthase
MHSADIITTCQQEKSESVLTKQANVHWNHMFDPVTKQLQVYENGRVQFCTKDNKTTTELYTYAARPTTLFHETLC